MRASFRFANENGTTLRLPNPVDVIYNGKKLPEGKFLIQFLSEDKNKNLVEAEPPAKPRYLAILPL